MIENLVTFITLMLLKDFPADALAVQDVRAFAEYLEGSGYTPAQLHADHDLFWRLDHTYRAYSHAAPFGSN